ISLQSSFYLSTGTVERGERLLYEGRFYRPDGSLRWVEFTGRPQGGPNSPCERVIGTVRDITERKHAEEELRASEAFSRSILKSSPDCIKVLDLQGNLLSLLTGHKLLGIKNVEPYLLKSWLEFWTGEHRGMAQLAVEAAAAGRTSSFVGFFRTLNAEPKWWDVLITPILDAEGKPVSLLAVSRDVTQSRQAKHMLIRQTAELNNLYATAPVGLNTFDTQLRYLRINQMMAEMNGLPAEQHIGKSLRDVLARQLADAVEPQLRQVLATGRPVLNFEVSGATVPRLSEQRHWLMSGHPVLDEQELICGDRFVLDEPGA
ncbi:PAS domain-containing protein, partial [Roseateles sp. GG27B]